ncbi:hypothetical protein AAG906_029136 [Vitis piasezkii]
MKILPNTGMTSLDSVLTQGMNMKKKHEVGFTNLLDLKQLENVDSCPARSLDMDSVIWRNGFCGQVEVLSAVVDSIANSVGADTIVDLGAGQVGPVLSSSVFQFCTCDPNVETA